MFCSLHISVFIGGKGTGNPAEFISVSWFMYKWMEKKWMHLGSTRNSARSLGRHLGDHP